MHHVKAATSRPFITNDHLDHEGSNRVVIGAGTAHTRKLMMKISKQFKNLRFSASASVYKTDGIDHSASDLMSNPEALENYGLSSDYRLGESMAKDFRFLNLSAEMDGAYLRAVLVDTQSKSHFNFPAYGKGHRIHYSDYNIAVGYKKKLSESWAFDTKLVYFKNRVWFKYLFLHDDFLGVQQLESRAYEYNLDVFYNRGDNFTAQSGIYYKNIGDIYNFYHLPSFLSPFLINNYIDTKDDIVSYAIYSQFNFKLGKNLQITAGFRLDKSDPYQIEGGFSYDTPFFTKQIGKVVRNRIEFIPRIAAIYRLSSDAIIKLLYGRAIRRPSFFQDYLQVQTNETTLFPEKIETIELNYQHILSRNYLLSFNLFQNILDNLITRLIILDDFGNYDYSYSTNAGRMITRGVELTFSAKPSDTFFLEFSATYQNTDDQTIGHDGIDLAYSPELLAYLKISYDLSPKLKISMNGRYVGPMKPYWDDAPDPESVSYIPIGRIGKDVIGYLDLGLNIRLTDIIKKGVFVNLKISNLLDSEIRYPVFTNNPYADKGTLDYGRHMMVTLGYAF